MPSLIDKFKKINKSYFRVASVLFLILLAIFLWWFNDSNSLQATPAILADVYFDGDYSINGGPWQKISETEHIPSTEGDVLLRGNFYMIAPDGEFVGAFRGDVPIAFYTDHINLTFYEVGFEPFVLETENPLYGSSLCGEGWGAHPFMGNSEDLIEILIHNPHGYGNETAIDEMLKNIAFWGDISFEKDVLNTGATQRNLGVMLMLVSVVFLGIALFSTLIHIRNSEIIWILAAIVLSAGSYFTYSSYGISFWSESMVTNTTILGVSMMFYGFFSAMLIACLLKSAKRVAASAVFILGVADAVIFALPILSGVFFYDTWIYWIFVQIAVNGVLTVCLIKEFFKSKAHKKWLCLGAFLPLIAFALDVLGTWLGIWKGGVSSQYVFIALFALAVIMILKLIPQNINAAIKAKELEMEKIVLKAELTESRVSTMMSQIRPHFIYNTLGSIEQLCEIDPKKAGELVHDFSKYLRGNFGELDNPKPILMSQEMEHVHHYVSIENVRFPDMTFKFEMNSSDFKIPALTVQPIVENAIKHGLMKLESGGTINVVSYETETEYCVSVVDDGVGFDTTLLLDERKHVGLRNIRERLMVMVRGVIEIESTLGVGTKVIIRIPKEGNE